MTEPLIVVIPALLAIAGRLLPFVPGGFTISDVHIELNGVPSSATQSGRTPMSSGPQSGHMSNDIEAVWAVGEHRWFYLLEDAPSPAARS